MIFTTLLSIRLYLNFGIGLKQAIPRSSLLRSSPRSEDGDVKDGIETTTSRVSID